MINLLINWIIALIFSCIIILYYIKKYKPISFHLDDFIPFSGYYLYFYNIVKYLNMPNIGERLNLAYPGSVLSNTYRTFNKINLVRAPYTLPSKTFKTLVIDTKTYFINYANDINYYLALTESIIVYWSSNILQNERVIIQNILNTNTYVMTNNLGSEYLTIVGSEEQGYYFRFLSEQSIRDLKIVPITFTIIE